MSGRQIRRTQSSKPQGDARFQSGVFARLAKKIFARTFRGDRTKTDTGRRGEKPQALERTLVKELGKLTP